MSDNNQLNVGATLTLASGAIAVGGTTSLIQTTVAIPYAIGGQFYSKGITNNIPWNLIAPPAVYSTGFSTAASFTGGVNGSTRLYAFYLDRTGLVSAIAGPIVDSAALAAGSAPLLWPPSVKDMVMFAAVRVALTANTTFTPNVTAIATAGGVTVTFLNTCGTPDTPFTV